MECDNFLAISLTTVGVVCDTTKGLESFAKAQRRNPIAAKCLVCMAEQLEFDPDLVVDQLNNHRRPVPAITDDYDDDSDEDSDNGRTYDYTTDGVNFSTTKSGEHKLT